MSATSGTCTIASIRAAPCTPDGRPASPPTRKSRSVSSIARRASGRSSLVLHRAAFVALIALGAGSLLFDLTMGFRLPSDADWAEAAGSLRSRARPDDAVQIWPVWAERARLFVDAAPVLAEEDLEHADYLEARRLWVPSLPRPPFFPTPDPALRARGSPPAGETDSFGAPALWRGDRGGAAGAGLPVRRSLVRSAPPALPAGLDDAMTDKALARALGFLTAAALAVTQAPVGFVRDEGYCFAAAQRYEAWLRLLLHAPLQAAAETEQYWSYNFEHPGLTKLLFAVSHLIFTTWLRVLPDALAWRLPAFAFAGLLSYWLCLLGLSRSRAAGVLAPLLFWCAERTFFHGHLACFDVPICALWAGVGVAWLRGSGPRLAGTYGVALAVKHNAWFLPPVLAVHALLLPRGERAAALRKLPWLLLSPLVLFAAWPLLWHDPLRHLRDWISFHSHHVHYAWWYFGQVLRAPPFPIEYPVVLDALVLPLPTALLLLAAGASLLVDFARRRLDAQRLLELGLAGAALLPFLLTATPIFGG